MTGCKNKDLDLSLEVFPTNCDGEFRADFYEKKFDEKHTVPPQAKCKIFSK